MSYVLDLIRYNFWSFRTLLISALPILSILLALDGSSVTLKEDSIQTL